MQVDPKMDNFDFELKGRSRTDALPATVENVRCTCTALADTPDCLVKIDKKQAFLFAEELEVQDVRRSSHYMKIPTKFGELNSELCFHVTLHLFNFGHGFRHPLHTTCGLGAWQTMKRGVETLHSKTERLFYKKQMEPIGQRNLEIIYGPLGKGPVLEK